jgi:hypothetical protein
MKLPKIDDLAGAGIQKNLIHPDHDESIHSPSSSRGGGAQTTHLKPHNLIHDQVLPGSAEKGATSRPIPGAGDFVVKVNRSDQNAESASRSDPAIRFDKEAPSTKLLPPLHTASSLEKAGALPNRLTDRVALGTAWEKVHAALKELVGQESKESPLFRTATGVLRALKNLAYSESSPHSPDFFRVFLKETGQTLEDVLSRLIQNPGYSHSPSHLKTDPLTSLLQELVTVANQSQGTEGMKPLIHQVLGSASTLADSMEWAQTLNSLTCSTNGELFFHIPFCVNTCFLTGYLYLNLNYGEREKKKKHRQQMLVVFFLDLPDLGGVRVDASLDSRNRVRIWVYMENKEALAFVQGRLPDLAEALACQDLQVDHITAVAARRFKLEEFCRKELVSGFLQGHIDLMI